MFLFVRMNIQIFRTIFGSDGRGIFFLVLGLIILWGGHTQAWVFSDKDMGLPKPFLYDLIEPFPFWIIGVFVFAPVGIFGNFIDATFGYHWGPASPHHPMRTVFALADTRNTDKADIRMK